MSQAIDANTLAASLPKLLATVESVLDRGESVLNGAESGGSAADADWPAIADRLRNSVLRPLLDALSGADGLGRPTAEGSVEPVETPVNSVEGSVNSIDSVEGSVAIDVSVSFSVDAALLALARTATRLRAQPQAPNGLVEATAALQHLVAGRPETAPVLAELARAQDGVPSGVQVSADGPYLVTGAVGLTDALGRSMPVTPTMALCRCGESASKPWCDGSHVRVGFTGAKDPERVADRRDRYPGVGVTVLDNRGICQHSGLCTDRLNRVFHAGEEPFVTASGARMDEIVDVVRSCPSGALSYAIDDREAREQVDRAGRAPSIEVSKDGPYRVTGGPALTGADGEPEPRAAGASTEHYALCRCGHSRNKPFCSGMHFYVGFSDPPVADEPSVFEWAGGFPALLRMTKIFYAKYVPADPLLSPLFADMSPDHPERVAAWLGEVFGGPEAYSGTYGGYARMISQHLGKHLSDEQRARWVSLLGQSANDAGLPNDAEFRAAFNSYLEWGSRIAVENSQPGALPPQGMPMPHWPWVAGAMPGSRISALATETEKPAAALPDPGQPLSFAVHIKQLFRAMDRNSMRFAFDLWSPEDVRTHAEAILARLRAGSMPCDGAWPTERIAVFADWIAQGTPE
ncbi:MAG TPA: CDGSH iron-sulfur domain-containing protein [Pseudonocardiaceae bacterium]|jgi:CDGSH-type Zn-finger protein|nr:CDGSH iron-sulfur domain-containing protein [Pseudonocardiaceae bacterium]